MKKVLITILILIFGFGLTVKVQAIQLSPAPELKSFRQVGGITPNVKNIPTVVEVPLLVGNGSANSYALQSSSSVYEFEPFQIRSEKTSTKFEVIPSGSFTDAVSLHDNNSQTYEDYQVQPPASSKAWSFSYDQPITTDQFTFQLAQFSREPVRIEITKISGDKEILIIAESDYTGSTISFPQTSSSIFRVTLTYSQPLRVTEMSFNQLGSSTSTQYYLRFLAKPLENYNLYTDPATSVSTIPYQEVGDLLTATNVIILDAPIFEDNYFFTPADIDGDSVLDEKDNCPAVPNPAQEDINNNGIGDACEDFDLDGVLNTNDNCPDVANRYQQDEDGDGIGDHCDKLESRLTERLFWLPWAGIIVGFGVVLGLLYTTIKKPVKQY